MKKKNFITYGLLVAAGVLLLGSAIGSTQAALTYYSENYTAEITISQIGVSLMENGKVVSSRDYNEDKWDISTNKKDSTSVSGALLTNMLDKEKGEIDIRILDEIDSVRVEIEDNGKGIVARDLPNIFERFFRTDASRNSAQGGSGIGLSIVKKIIEDHGGYLWATSREGEGTCMHFVIRKYQETQD